MRTNKRTYYHQLAVSLLFLCLPFTPLQAEIFVWTDKNGNKVYGDEPQKSDQAQAVELSPITVLEFPKQAPKDTPVPQTDKSIRYTSFTILSPSDDATVKDNTGSIAVSLSSEPALIEGHKIQLYLDGSPYLSPQASTSITLANVDRGTHSLSASLLDEAGQALLTSSTVTFHLHRFAAK